jgi:L-threonylcarbamoyladenylate synthase
MGDVASERYPTGTDEEREAAVEAATLALQRGLLAVIPTDTVYGVAADAFDTDAVHDLLEAKGRGREMPPPVLVSAATTLDALATKVPAYARSLIEEFWPGALTIVCRSQPSLEWDLGDARGTVAIRMPDHELALEILERTGPLAVSSANRTGSPAATDADQAEEMLGDAVAVVVDDGPTPTADAARASTIIDATARRPRVLRAGAIGLDQLNDVLEPLGLAISDDRAAERDDASVEAE